MTFRPTREQRLVGEAARLPAYEHAIIIAFADAFHVPPALLAAIRLAENGGPGREFGVLSVPLAQRDTYGEQARLCAETIFNNFARYMKAVGQSPYGPDGTVTDAYLAFLANRYAPIGASNDPTDLNRHWLGLVRRFYRNSYVEMVA